FSKIENFFPDNWEKFFPTTGKKFPDNWKKISRQLEKNFPTTGKVLPSNRKSSSFQQEKFFLPTGHKRMSHVPPTESIPKPEEPKAAEPQQTY
ncbi:hypothetical protein TVAG_202420, partial [Trichomonas vaginalis G3]